ncbi:hypothetical protein Tco_0089690 [Tanacetum coccineum]
MVPVPYRIVRTGTDQSPLAAENTAVLTLEVSTGSVKVQQYFQEKLTVLTYESSTNLEVSTGSVKASAVLTEWMYAIGVAGNPTLKSKRPVYCTSANSNAKEVSPFTGVCVCSACSTGEKEWQPHSAHGELKQRCSAAPLLARDTKEKGARSASCSLTSEGGNKDIISGATKSIYAPEPSDVGRILLCKILQ